MVPVVGIDVAKGVSVLQAQALWKRNEPYGKAESIAHGETGFKRLGELLAELQEKTSVAPIVVLEATGHDHRALVGYLKLNGWKHFIVNPLQSKRSKGTQLRKVKTDTADAWNSADIYDRGDVKPHRTWGETYTELQHITRQHEVVSGIMESTQDPCRTKGKMGDLWPPCHPSALHIFDPLNLFSSMIDFLDSSIHVPFQISNLHTLHAVDLAAISLDT